MDYEPDYRQIGRIMKRHPELRRACRGAATEIRTILRALAPTDPRARPPDRGSYAKSFKIRNDDSDTRMGVSVYSEDEAAGPLEFGTRDIAAREPMARTARLLGYDLRDEGEGP